MSQVKQMKYFSLFSGIGGFELGIQLAWNKIWRTESRKRWQHNAVSEFHTKSKQPEPLCIGYSEIDKYATQIYKSHFPTHKEYGNVTSITWPTVPDFEMVVGGFPCQSFSIAGKRGGFDDTRGTLFFEIIRCLREKQPRLCVLENVKGLLSHDKGRTFGVILASLDEIGYDMQWQVLNSKNHRVPQNRERVFIVGHLRGTGRPEVFPIGFENTKNSTGFTSKMNRWLRQVSKYQRDYLHHENEICSTLSAFGGNNLKGIGLQQDNLKIRRLTPTECERLQGFPDGWTEELSDTQRYKCLGNAVTVNVIEAITRRLF